MPQHVRMDAEWHPGALPKPGQHPAKGNGSHRGAALAHEDIPPRLLLSLETAQRAKLSAGQRVDGGHAVLQPMDVQPGNEASVRVTALGPRLAFVPYSLTKRESSL